MFIAAVLGPCRSPPRRIRAGVIEKGENDVSLTAHLPVLLAVGLFLIAAVNDLRERRIPNWISVALLALYVALAVADPDKMLIWQSLLTGLAVFAVLFALFRFGYMGGGDVKLWTVAAVLMGPHYVLPMLVLTSLTGLAIALPYYLSRLVMRVRLMTMWAWIPAWSIKHEKLPYGVAIAFGGSVCFALRMGAISL